MRPLSQLGSLAAEAQAVMSDVEAMLAEADDQAARLRVAKDALVRIEAVRHLAQKALRDLEHTRINARELINVGEAKALSIRVKEVQSLLYQSEEGLRDAMTTVTTDVQEIWRAVTFNAKVKKVEMNKSLLIALRVATHALRCFVQFASLCQVVAAGASAFPSKYNAPRTMDMAREMAAEAVAQARSCAEGMTGMHKVVMGLEPKEGADKDVTTQLQAVRDASKGYIKAIKDIAGFESA